MPRIFHVTLQRELDCTIVAEDEAELEAALNSLSDTDFDDWNPPEWTWSIRDPLKRIKTVKDLDFVPDDYPSAPDMGVLDGEVLSFQDVKVEVPTILDEVSEEIKAVKRRVTLNEVNEKLPLGDDE